MSDVATSIGRVRSVLVFGQDDDAKAVISWVVAHTRDCVDSELVSFVGPVAFEEPTAKHTRDVLIPVVDGIADSLGLPKRSFEISVVNPGAASVSDLGVRIRGFSADVPVLLAMLSAALKMPAPDDIVTTGHIASVEGDIGAVKAIPAKVQAAGMDDSVRYFICPDLEKDKSLTVLSPKQRQLSIEAIAAARNYVRIKSVCTIAELIEEVFTEQSIIEASLESGFYGVIKKQSDCMNPLQTAVYFLANNKRRFWKVLQRYFMTGKGLEGRRLLEAFARFHIAQKSYPAMLGHKLFELICSLPPVVRRLKMDFPILDTGLCIELSTFARKSDYMDVPVLFDAAHGRNIAYKSVICSAPPEPTTSDSDCTAFDMLTAHISEQAFARKYGIAIDSARGSYALDSSTVSSYDQFIDTVQAFYIHVQQYLHPDAALDMDKTRSEATDILERAFRLKGGEKWAFGQAMDGTQGGLRSVLDTFTDQYKRERRAAYIRKLFKEAVDSMDWDQRVAFMCGAMKRMGPFLPPELKDEPPERFAGNYEAIVQAYVQSLDRVGQLLRTM